MIYKKIIYKLLAVFIAAIVVLPYNMVFANRANMDTSFDVGVPIGFDDSVKTMVSQLDGKLVIGGYFLNYKGVSANRIIRLNVDGSRDSSFDVGDGFDNFLADDGVTSLALQSNGKIIVGGDFTTYKGVNAKSIIRLNADGSRDSSFDIGNGFDGAVYSIVLQSDGKIIVGGSFTTYKGIGANKIIRLNTDGSRDSSFDIGNGFDGTYVLSLAVQSDGKILIGGSFTTYKGVGANRIIRLNTDGSRDSSFDIGNGFNGAVYSIVLQSDGKIIVGGSFTTYKGVGANRIIRLNTDGSRDSSFDIGNGFDAPIKTIKLQNNGKILVGGAFSEYDGVSANGIIDLNTDGSRDSSFDIGNGLDGEVLSILVTSNGNIFLGGGFMTYGSFNVNRIASISSLGSINNVFDIGNGFGDGITSIAIQSDGKIIVGGIFSSYKLASYNKIIRLNSNGSIDTSFDIGDGFDSYVSNVAIQSDGKIIVVGSFTTYKGVSANRIVRLNTDGSRDSSFDIGNGFNGDPLFDTLTSIAIQSDGKIIIGGEFTTYKGVSANRIIRLNTDGSRDSSFDIGNGFNGRVNSIAIQSDGKIIVGGQFTTYKGVSANKIIRLNTDGSRDSGFDIGTGFDRGDVFSIAIQSNNKVMIGGSFGRYKGLNASKIIRLNTDGSRDSGFDIGDFENGFDGGNNVNTIKIQSDGKIIAGGDFSTYKGVSVNKIVRLHSGGTIDSSFDIGNGFGDDWMSNVLSIELNNGKLIVGGTFNQYKETIVSNLVTLYGDSDIIIVPNSTNTATVASEFTTKGYTQSNGDLIGSKSFSLSLTDGNIPVNLNLKNNNIKLSIPADTQFKKSDNVTNYDGIVSVPIPKSISSIADKPVLSAFKVGSSESLKLVGGEATLSAPIAKSVGDPVIVYYSEDNGATWYPHTITSVSDVSGQPTVSFTTTHFTDFAILDGEGMFTINYDAASTTLNSVTLNISTTPPSSYMRFSNDGTNRSAREAYATSKSWTLSEGYGSKTVYAQFDADGNQISDAQTSDTINYTDGSSGGACEGGEGVACLNLEITAVTGECRYGINLDLGDHAQTYSAFTMTGAFLSNHASSTRWSCNDTAGKSPWNMQISSTDLIVTGSSYSIDNTAIEMKTSTATKYRGSNSFTGLIGAFAARGTNLSTPRKIFEKTSPAGTVGEIGTDTVDLRVLIPTNQEVGAYQATITIAYPQM